MQLRVTSRKSAPSVGGDTIFTQGLVLLIGSFFGIVLVKSEVVSWFRI
ncbi:MAG: hypothetical protein AAF629_26795 [Chloroflexota bacterium]